MDRFRTYHVFKNCIFSFLGLLLFLFTLGISKETALAATEINTTAPAKVTIAYNVGNPPLKFTSQQGEASGILIDIWRLWSKKTGIEIDFKQALFADTLEMVKNGEADIHAGLFYTKDRDVFLDYSEPLIDIKYYAFHHESLPTIIKLPDLHPYRIGVPKGYTHSYIKENLPGAALELFDNFPALYDSAMGGSIRVFVSPVMNFEYYLQQKKLTNPFRYNPAKPIYNRTYYGAVQEGNRALRNVINLGMAQISEAERIAIERKWFKRTKGNGEKKTFIIACDSNDAPLTMLNARGEPAGLFVAIWKKWAEKENVQIQFLFDNWEGSIQAVKQGLADFHSGLESHEPWLVASQPFYELSVRLFFPQEKQFLSLDDLTGRKIGSIHPFYADILQRTNPDLEIILVNDYMELFSKIRSGEVDAFIDDQLAVENRLLSQGRQGEFSTIADFNYNSPVSAVVHKNNNRLLKQINNGLQAISLEEYKQQEANWLKDPTAEYYHRLDKRIVLTEEEEDWLRAHPVIRIGVDQDYAPYAFVNEQGLFKGVAADYAKLLSDKLGVQLEMVPGLSWPEILDGARNKTVDVITTASWRAERDEYLTFSQGYIPTPLVVMSRSDDNRIKTREDLKDQIVALVTEYSSSKHVLEDFPSVQVYPVATPLQGLQAVAIGKADAYVGVLGINVLQAKRHGISNLKVAAPYDLDTNYQCYGVRKDWPQLTTLLNKALDSIPDKEKLEIINRWVPVGSQADITLQRPILTKKEKDFIKNHPVIRLGVDPEFFPFEFVNKNGSYSGIASDYIKILNTRLGLDMQVTPKLSWDEVISKSKTQEIAILPCVGKTKERLSYLNYSTPYITFQRVVIARSDFPFIAGLDELKDFKVAVQANTSHSGFLRDNINLTPQSLNTLQESLIAVSNGNADAFIGNLASATFWIRKLHLTNLKVAAPVEQGGKQSLYFAIRKDWPELVSIINKGLKTITAEEEDKIYQKWVSVKYEPGIAPKTVVGYVIKIIGGTFILFFLFFVWNYRLKKEIIQREEAESKLQHYAEELEKVNTHLQGLDKLKSMFIASMSHELRTPLNSIIGFTGVILQGMTGEINERQKDQLSRVYRSAKHLLSLISDVIDISKIEAGRIDVYPEPFLLVEIIDEAMENIQPQLKTKNLTLEAVVPTDLHMQTDRKRLLQCIINYLSNGVKFTEQGGIKIMARNMGDEVEITVTDTGIGIEKEDINKLFEAFERLETHLRVKAGGTGLGLYLTKKLVTEVLQGDILATSEIGKGSTFGLRIPKSIINQVKE